MCYRIKQRATKKKLKNKSCRKLKVPDGWGFEAEYFLGSRQKWLKFKRGECPHGDIYMK